MTKKKAKKKAKKKTIEKVTSPAQVSSKPKITPHPTAGRVVQEFEDQLDAQLAGEPAQLSGEPLPAPKPKRGPGRPPKEPGPAILEPPELTIDIVAGVVKIPFELWSISQSLKSLALTDSEAKKIAEPAQQLLEHYLPQIPVIAYAWVSMSVSTFWVMQSRLRTIREIQLHREIQKETRPAEAAGPGVVTKFPTEIIQAKV